MRGAIAILLLVAAGCGDDLFASEFEGLYRETAGFEDGSGHCDPTGQFAGEAWSESAGYILVRQDVFMDKLFIRAAHCDDEAACQRVADGDITERFFFWEGNDADGWRGHYGGLDPGLDCSGTVVHMAMSGTAGASVRLEERQWRKSVSRKDGQCDEEEAEALLAETPCDLLTVFTGAYLRRF